MAITTHPALPEDSVPSPWLGQRMTLAEFLALPDHKPSLEFDRGVVTQKMPPKPVHGRLQPLLVQLFNEVAGPKQLGIAFSETRFVTPDWAPVPDVSYYRRERITLKDGALPDEFTIPPDLVVEIVSPSQNVTALIRKCLRHIDVGVPIAVLIDPSDQAVLLFRPHRAPRILQGDDRIDLDEVLPRLELTVGGLFAALVPDWLAQP